MYRRGAHWPWLGHDGAGDRCCPAGAVSTLALLLPPRSKPAAVPRARQLTTRMQPMPSAPSRGHHVITSRKENGSGCTVTDRQDRAATNGKPVHFTNSATHGQWQDGTDPEGIHHAHPDLHQAIESLLTSKRLSVLAGLGTSLAVTTAEYPPPTMSDLWARVQQEAPEDFAAALDRANYQYQDEEAGDIEELLSKCQAAIAVSEDETLSRFVRRAEAVIAEACRFVHPGTPLPTHESFLRKVARRGRDEARLQLFTTNYDLAFEVAASNTGTIVVDGFGYSYPSVFDPGNFGLDIVKETPDGRLERLPALFRLHKLHGSVDWARTHAGVAKDPKTERPVIVYPRSQKFELSYEPPFFDGFSAYNEALKQDDLGVLVVGSGFRDRHIVQPLLSAFKKNANLQAVIVSPSIPEHPPTNGVHGQVKSLIDAGDHRHTLVSGTFEHLVKAIPQLRHVTQREIHDERVYGVEE